MRVYCLISPCQKLKGLYQSSPDHKKANIKPDILDLQGKLSEEYEHGKSIEKDLNGVYTIKDIPATGTDKIRIPSGEYYIADIHVHQYPEGVPMFSWEDVFSLYKLYNNAYSPHYEEVCILLVCKDDNGVNEVYSLVVDDPNTFYDAIIQDIQQNPKINSNTSQDEILEKMDADLTILYDQNGTNREKSFLNRFTNFGISLYKADENLTTWSKLTLENGTVKIIPCN